jgi:tetratricopeptide (TPR) repeat protein
VALFLHRAQAVTPDFHVTTATAPTVAAICVRLEGLPLAIELAAVRIKILSPEALLHRLSSQLTLLTGGARDLPTRQQTIRATIDWSYHLLSPAEQRLFGRLAVFVGGWTVAAAEAVCTAGGDLPLAVLDGLQSLLDNSLLRQMEGADGEPRFMMLETVREYALERLTASGEATAVRQRHARYYLALMEDMAPKLRERDQIGLLQRLDREHDNFRGALSWALCPAGPPAATELALHLCLVLREFWARRWYFREARQWLEAALALPAPGALRVLALLEAAELELAQPDFVRSQALVEKALALARTLGDVGSIARALQLLAGQARRDGDQARAHGLLEESLVCFQKVGDMVGSAQVLYELGELAGQRDDRVQQCTYLEESLAQIRATGDQQKIAWTLWHLGSWWRMRPEKAGACAALEESLTLFQALDNQIGRAYVLRDLGATLRDLGDIGRALGLLEESVALFRAMGDKEGLGWALLDLGETLLLSDDVRAHALEQESAALFQEIGHRVHMAFPLLNLAHIAKHQGDYGRAYACFAQSLALFWEGAGLTSTILSLAGVAGVAARQGHLERAVRLFGAAEALFEVIHQEPLRAHRIELERDVAAAHAQLDAATWSAAWAEGRAMTLEQAIAYARQEAPDV